MAYWSENHCHFSGKYKKKFLAGAFARLNWKYKGEQEQFSIAQIRRKCDYMKARFNQVYDEMERQSGFGVEEITTKPDLRATTLAKFPLYEAMAPFMLEKVNVNPHIVVEVGSAKSTGNMHVQGQGAADFVTKITNSKDGIVQAEGSYSDDDSDSGLSVSSTEDDNKIAPSVLSVTARPTPKIKHEKNDKKSEVRKTSRGGYSVGDFVEVTKDQMKSNAAFREKMLSLMEEDKDIRKSEGERALKKSKVELLLSVAAASRDAGDLHSDKIFRDKAADIADEF